LAWPLQRTLLARSATYPTFPGDKEGCCLTPWGSTEADPQGRGFPTCGETPSSRLHRHLGRGSWVRLGPAPRALSWPSAEFSPYLNTALFMKSTSVGRHLAMSWAMSKTNLDLPRLLSAAGSSIATISFLMFSFVAGSAPEMLYKAATTPRRLHHPQHTGRGRCCTSAAVGASPSRRGRRDETLCFYRRS
jgi:hypothetical protein